MLAAGSALQIDFVTAGIHAGLFLVVMFFVSRFMLNPLSRVHKLRKEWTSQRADEAQALTEKADRLESEYSSRLTSARQDALAQREAVRQKGFDEATNIMASARQESFAALEKAKDQLDQEALEVKDQIAKQMEPFAQQVAERILGREVNELKKVREA